MMKSEGNIYKNKEEDKLSYKLSVPCSYTLLTLTQKPTFQCNETIYGWLALKSNEFWEIANGKEHKYRVDLKAYFAAKSLEEQ